MRVGHDHVVAGASDDEVRRRLVGEAQGGVGARRVEPVDAVAAIYRKRGVDAGQEQGVAALSGGDAGVAVGDDDEVIGLVGKLACPIFSAELFFDMIGIRL
ncbi:MAG: hypothetical protein IT510_18145 [Sulfuritalea sp.]|nr:hypothetical protein [Sulfuritalea sp.]